MPIRVIPECRYCGVAVEPTEPMGAWIHTGLSIWCPGDAQRRHTATPIIVVEEVSKLGQSEGQVQYTSTTFNEDGTTEVRTFPPGPPITLDDLSKLGQSEPMPINEQGYPIYPVGTPIAEVGVRDRGQKMIFQCDLHPEVTWASKDPFVSRWFGNPEQTPACNCPTEHFFLSQPYSPTRND